MYKPLHKRGYKDFKDPLFLYKLLRMKMKIGYQSCVEDVSLKELFLTAIIKTYDEIKAKAIETSRFYEELGNVELTPRSRNL